MGMGNSGGDDVPCRQPVPIDGRDEFYLQGNQAVALALFQKGKHWSLGKEAQTLLVALDP